MATPVLRRFAFAVAVPLLLIAVIVPWRPEWIVLVFPNVRVSSPYCSRWKAARDERLQLNQYAFAKQLKDASHRLRSEGALELWQTPMGAYWIPAGSSDVLVDLLAQQARSIYGKVAQGEVVIDCGAHVGVFVRTALTQGAEKVIAVEPAPQAVECLRRNFAREIATGKVVVVAKGIWDHDGTLTFYRNGNGEAADSFVNHGSTSQAEVVPVTTLDTLSKELDLTRVSMIKADVKGAASRALTGGREMIGRFHPRLALATEEPPEDPEALSAQIQRDFRGYRAVCGPCLVVEHEIRTDVMFFL